jgi:hypothetical protein
MYKPLKNIVKFKELIPLEAEVRGSNPLGVTSYINNFRVF